MTTEKQSAGPSKASGVGSLIIGILALLWTGGSYVKNGPGIQAFLGFALVVFCFVHATFNFQAAKKQKAAGRSAQAQAQVQTQAQACTASEKAGAKNSRLLRYPVYRVKKKPQHILRRGHKQGA